MAYPDCNTFTYPATFSCSLPYGYSTAHRYAKAFNNIPVAILLNRPVAHDYLDLAQECTEVVAEIIEQQDPTTRLALCGRLGIMLSRLKSLLEQPLTPEQRKRLTVEKLPRQALYEFAADTTFVCDYACAVVHVLLTRIHRDKLDKTLTGLLFDLTHYLCDWLTEPQFEKFR